MKLSAVPPFAAKAPVGAIRRCVTAESAPFPSRVGVRSRSPSGLWGTVGMRATSDLEVNDANLGEADGATVLDARAGYRFCVGVLELAPFAGARNLGGVDYPGSIRPNDRFLRYYEPAPETEIYAGIEVTY